MLKNFFGNKIQSNKYDHNTDLMFVNYIFLNLIKYIRMIIVNKDKNNFNIYLKDHRDIDVIILFFKRHTQMQFNVLSDIFGVDLLNKKKRFNIAYCLSTFKYNSRIRINLFLNENEKITTTTFIFNNSGWLEREIWDLLGIFFEGNPDLRRILTDYGFDGFPLRKDFPLNGFIELRYDDSLKRIVYEAIEITQEYRFYDFESPWDHLENLY
jgi:NADH:ubiquinone oxidoreductase subunit C